MLPDKVKDFAAQTHRGVLTTFRRNGAAQMSIISCGPYRDGIAFTVTEDRVKLKNLRRNARCTLLVSEEAWRPFVVVEGRARLPSADKQMPKSSRRLLGRHTARARAKSTPSGRRTSRRCATTAAQ